MRKNHRYDYADMILWVIDAFKKNPALAAPYREQYRYILVDEYQDTSGAQNEILELLTQDDDDYANVFCVGDDDQSIYEFQGARILNIIEFAERFSTEQTRWLLPKGRSAMNELQSLTGWRHRFHVEQSITDINAGIIIGHLYGRQAMAATS